MFQMLKKLLKVNKKDYFLGSVDIEQRSSCPPGYSPAHIDIVLQSTNPKCVEEFKQSDICTDDTMSLLVKHGKIRR